VLVLDNSAADRDRICSILSANGFRPIGIPFDADLKGVLARDPVAVVLVGMSHASDHELSIGIKVNASASGTTLPIIMCAPQWTRSSVLRAMKYGARDICLKQCDGDELVEKVSRLLQAA
jgi:DNA-binding NarL/FixJ family response regulator